MPEARYVGSHSSAAPMTPRPHPLRSHVAAEGVPHVAALGEGADGVGGDQADPAEDGVGDERVAVEEPLLVVAQGEVVEGAGAVPAHDVAGPQLGRGPPADRGSCPRSSRRSTTGRVSRYSATTIRLMPDRQQAGGDIAVDGGGKRHRLHADEPLGRPRAARRARGAAGGGARGRRPRPPRSRRRWRRTPPTARMAKAVTRVACSVWARNSSRWTIRSVRTAAQTSSVMTSAAWTR